MKQKITIKEIAHEAGVSVSTVSRVINNPESVKPEKRALVQQVIDRLEFRPNAMARSLILKKTNEIAVVLSDVENPYFTSLVSQIDVACRAKGYALLLFNTLTAGSQRLTDPVSEECAIFDTIARKSVDGVIILGGEIDKNDPDTRYIDALNELAESVPVVIVGVEKPRIKAHFLPRALRQGSFIAVQHLLALGHTAIGFLGGEPGVTITDERVNAYCDALTMYGHTAKPEWVALGDYYAQSGYASMGRILKLDPKDRPTAMLAVNDKVALGGIRALADAGLSCPRDMAIVSCDAFPDGEYAAPRITAVSQNDRILGSEAVHLLTSLVDNKEPEPVRVHTPELIIRESCGARLSNDAEARS